MNARTDAFRRVLNDVSTIQSCFDFSVKNERADDDTPENGPFKVAEGTEERLTRDLVFSQKRATGDYAAVKSAAAGSAQRLIMHLCGELVSSEV